MSLTKHNAPPVLGPISFAGVDSQLILIEADRLSLLSAAMDKAVVVFMAEDNQHEFEEAKELCFLHQDWIAVAPITSLQKIIKSIKNSNAINVNFVIHGIDKMDRDLDPRERGRIHKGLISTLTPKAIGKSNVFITSESDEYTLREICDRYYDLRWPH